MRQAVVRRAQVAVWPEHRHRIDVEEVPVLRRVAASHAVLVPRVARRLAHLVIRATGVI